MCSEFRVFVQYKSGYVQVHLHSSTTTSAITIRVLRYLKVCTAMIQDTHFYYLVPVPVQVSTLLSFHFSTVPGTRVLYNVQCHMIRDLIDEWRLKRPQWSPYNGTCWYLQQVQLYVPSRDPRHWLSCHKWDKWAPAAEWSMEYGLLGDQYYRILFAQLPYYRGSVRMTMSNMMHDDEGARLGCTWSPGVKDYN